jgi:hypothetical protein
MLKHGVGLYHQWRNGVSVGENKWRNIGESYKLMALGENSKIINK